MINNQLEWRALQPDTDSVQSLFSELPDDPCYFSEVQSRLFNTLSLLLDSQAKLPLMLVKTPEHPEYQALLQTVISGFDDESVTLYGGHYHIDGAAVSWRPAESEQDNFASTGGVHSADWIEAEQLFGCFRQYKIGRADV